MSTRSIEQYINDILDGKNAIVEGLAAEDLNAVQGRYRSMIYDLQITEQTLDSSLKEISASLFADSTNNGSVVSFLLFSKELDSFHAVHSTWYRRAMLINTLRDIFIEYTDKIIDKNDYIPGLSLILIVISLILILL